MLNISLYCTLQSVIFFIFYFLLIFFFLFNKNKLINKILTSGKRKKIAFLFLYMGLFCLTDIRLYSDLDLLLPIVSDHICISMYI